MYLTDGKYSKTYSVLQITPGETKAQKFKGLSKARYLTNNKAVI